MNLESRTRTARGFILLLAGLALPAPDLSAQRPTGRLAPADVFNLQAAAAPAISPDGATIVYVRERADIMSDARYSNLWLVNADGTGHRALTTGNFTDMSPAWSPDGSRILFLSTRENGFQIWAYRLDGDRMTRVTNVERMPWAPVWSPDGRTIAFSSVVPRKLLPIANVPAAPTGAQWAPPARVLDRAGQEVEDAHVTVVSQNPNVAEIDEDGSVIARGVGNTMLILRSNQLISEVPVEVVSLDEQPAT